MLRLQEIRKKRGLSQEKLAELLGVSRQAVQKWENGISKPDIENLMALTRQLNVSADVLLGCDPRTVEELRLGKKLVPSFSEMHAWDTYQAQLPVELRQCLEEGKDFEKYAELFEAAARLESGPAKDKIADALFELVMSAPQRADWKYNEPDAYEDIRACCGQEPGVLQPVSAGALARKIRGAWLGRACGCLLGKPLEGRHTDLFHPLLKRTDNFPMKRYLRSDDFTEADEGPFQLRRCGAWLGDITDCMPIDDDTNYTVLGMRIIEDYGLDFTPQNVADAWIRYQSKNAYCTAERVAYINFINGYRPPASAAYKNPYREWIGAQIRADYYGYVNPCKPVNAAHMAWRDASISHVKNGIYGEMFVAAMLAAAAAGNVDELDVLAWGLSQIPAQSRLHEAVENIIAQYQSGVSCEECFAGIHGRYDEHDAYDWCGPFSNAEIVTAALLYGKESFGKAICLAVQTGFDTDCNGATVGSIYGMLHGDSAIGPEWAGPVNDTIDTSIMDVGKVKISEMVEKTLAHIALHA